jgi:hypothetical protein
MAGESGGEVGGRSAHLFACACLRCAQLTSHRLHRTTLLCQARTQLTLLTLTRSKLSLSRTQLTLPAGQLAVPVGQILDVNGNG